MNSEQHVTTRGHNHKSLHQLQLQRDVQVSTQPTVSITQAPPQDRAASLIHGHTTAIWAAAGTGGPQGISGAARIGHNASAHNRERDFSAIRVGAT